MKVLSLNNYDFEYILKEWQKDGQSAHQLFGITKMSDYGVESAILPFSRFNFLKKLSEQVKVLGDLDQELRVLMKSRDYDLIYSGHYITNSLLAFLRKIGIFRKPLVAVSFQSPRKTLFGTIYVSLFVSGNDKIICLSENIKEHFEKDFGIPSERLEMIEWGYDTAFHQPKTMNQASPQDSPYILSTGRSYRDYKTLLEAFSTLNYPLEIAGCSSNILDLFENIPQNIKITIPLADALQDLSDRQLPENIKTIDRLLTTAEILAKYNGALAVAIPLEVPTHLHTTIGFTSLVEAMCMGKAVLITENKAIDVVPEKEGIGFTIPYQDVQAWRQAVQYLVEHPEETKEMGQRARYMAEKRYNLTNYTQKTIQCMKSLVD